jgi:hypothetical protein
MPMDVAIEVAMRCTAARPESQSGALVGADEDVALAPGGVRDERYALDRAEVAGVEQVTKMGGGSVAGRGRDGQMVVHGGCPDGDRDGAVLSGFPDRPAE